MWNRSRLRRLIAPVMMGSKSYMSKVLATGPIAYWPLNETSGSAAVNYGSLGTAANGSYNGPTLGAVAAPVGWDAAATTFPTFGAFVVEKVI